MTKTTKVADKSYQKIIETGHNGEDREQQALIVFRSGLVPNGHSIKKLEGQGHMATIDDAYLVADSYGAEQIVEAILLGVPMIEIAKAMKLRVTHLLSWLRADPARESKWNQARKDYATLLQDEVINVTSKVPKTSQADKWQERRAKYLSAVAQQVNPPDKAATGTTIRLTLGFSKVKNPAGVNNRPIIQAETLDNRPTIIESDDIEDF